MYLKFSVTPRPVYSINGVDRALLITVHHDIPVYDKIIIIYPSDYYSLLLVIPI